MDENGLTGGEIQQLDQIIVAIGKVEGGEDEPKRDKPTSTGKVVDDRSAAKKSRFSIKGWGSKKDKKSNEEANDESTIEMLKMMDEMNSQLNPATHIISDFETVPNDGLDISSQILQAVGGENDPNKPQTPKRSKISDLASRSP